MGEDVTSILVDVEWPFDDVNKPSVDVEPIAGVLTAGAETVEGASCFCDEDGCSVASRLFSTICERLSASLPGACIALCASPRFSSKLFTRSALHKYLISAHKAYHLGFPFSSTMEAGLPASLLSW